MNHIQTIREALEILRGAVGHADTIAAADRGLTALAELEAQQPVAWLYDWLPAGGPTAYDWISGSKAEVFAPENCYFNIRPLYAAPVAQQPQAELERTHYTAEDVADASAKGFRDGAASVTAGQVPVAWAVYWGLPPTRKNSVHFDKESAQAVANQIKSATEVRPLYAAPVAQQPLITIEDSLRFRLDCTKERLEAAERECSELRAKLKAQQPQAEGRPIQECYGDCPTNPATCANPCKFNGRPAPQQAEAVPITSESGNQAAQGASAITSVPLLTDEEIQTAWVAHGLDDCAVEDFVRAIEQAVRSKMGAGVGWQPIETAPRGQRVLVWIADKEVDEPIAFAKVWFYADGTPGGGAEGFSGKWNLTHWHPLPPPPGIVGKEGGNV